MNPHAPRTRNPHDRYHEATSERQFQRSFLLNIQASLFSAERNHPRDAVYGLLGLLSTKLPGTDLWLFKVDYGIKTVPVLTKLWQLSMKTYRLLDFSSHLADRSTWKRQGLPSCGPDSAAFYTCYAGLSEGNSSSRHSQIADFFQYEALMGFLVQAQATKPQASARSTLLFP